MTIDEAEKAIQSVLIDLVNSTGRDIDLVRVDTRNFANLAVEIFLMPVGPIPPLEGPGESELS